jgi:hypothetical protein
VYFTSFAATHTLIAERSAIEANLAAASSWVDRVGTRVVCWWFRHFFILFGSYAAELCKTELQGENVFVS